MRLETFGWETRENPAAESHAEQKGEAGADDGLILATEPDGEGLGPEHLVAEAGQT